MGEVKAILLGVPKLMLGENVVSLPFKQAEALCYYLLTEKKADKYRIADLIWGDKHTEEKVKTNMRNALYVIRKTLGRDFLWEQGQNVISLNPNWNITVDTDILTMDMDVPSSQYFGEFLDNFYLKNNEFYNEWVLSTRRYLKTLYINKLKKYIADSFALSNFDQCERYCNYLLTADEFDEVAYRGLIALYQRKKEYSKALDLYKKLEKLLSEELFEVPAKETQMLAQKVKEERNHEIVEIINQRNHINKLNQEKKRLFYGRKAEMGMISEELHSFITDNNAHSIFLSGEAGIGKTSLAEAALDNIRDKPDVYILHTRCYHAEKDYLLKPWQNIFEQLLECLDSSGDKKRKDSILNATSAIFPYLYDEAQVFSDISEMTALQYANYEKVLINTLLKLPAAHKYVFFFDDLQYADKSSVALIFNIIMTGKNKNILFILTCREEQYDFADLFAGELKRASLLKRKTLERFSSEETACFAKLLLPDYEFTDEHYSRLYQETEGNPFFIIEMLNSVKYNTSFTGLTPNIKEVMRGRITHLPIGCQKVLDLLSLFFDGAPFGMLLWLSNKEEYELVEILEVLMAKRLIREENKPDGVVFQFTHQKILEYVYQRMSFTKRSILHNKVGICYEKELTNNSSDLKLYSKLIYHFDKGGDSKKYLKYSIKYVHNYLNMAHEYYPVIDLNQLDEASLGGFIKMSDINGIHSALSNITEMVEKNAAELTDLESVDFLSDYYHMMGRKCIREVDYKNGLRYIFRLKNLNKECSSKQQVSNLLRANHQLVCVYINRYQISEMRSVIADSNLILKAHEHKQEDMAIWIRHFGRCEIMSGNLDKGTVLLNDAIKIFENSPEKGKYLFNLAAAYAWLGEAKRHKMCYEKALDYYERAIQIHNSHDMIGGGVATFYTYAGIASYDSGDIARAEYYLKQAVDMYDKVDLMWGRGMAFCYYSLLCSGKGLYSEAYQALTKAGIYAEKLDSNYERGVIKRIYAQMSDDMASSPEMKKYFGMLITDSPQTYSASAKKLLKNIFSPIDIIYLERY